MELPSQRNMNRSSCLGISHTCFEGIYTNISGVLFKAEYPTGFQSACRVLTFWNIPSAHEWLSSPPALQIKIFGRYCRDSCAVAVLAREKLCVHLQREALPNVPYWACAGKGRTSCLLLCNFTVWQVLPQNSSKDALFSSPQTSWSQSCNRI